MKSFYTSNLDSNFIDQPKTFASYLHSIYSNYELLTVPLLIHIYNIYIILNYICIFKSNDKSI